MATTTKPADPAPVLPTHAQGLALFQAVIDALQIAGWVRVRVDTFNHPSNADQRRSAMTVRHHYDHGTWELYYERDKYWNRDARPTSVARIRLDRELPPVETVINELFGPHIGRYFPATNLDTAPKPRRARPSRPLRRPAEATPNGTVYGIPDRTE